MTQIPRVSRSTDRRGGPRRVTLTLPAARPGLYIAWMAHWRAAQVKARERPEVRDLAAREGAPFAGPVARYAADALVTPIMDQALEATRARCPTLAPSLTLEPGRGSEALDLMARQREWLAHERVQRSFGIRALEPEARELALRALGEAREHLRS